MTDGRPPFTPAFDEPGLALGSRPGLKGPHPTDSGSSDVGTHFTPNDLVGAVRGGSTSRDVVSAAAAPGQGTPFTLVSPRYASEPFRPTCPIAKCSRLCDHDALWCVECGTRLYTLESGRYGAKS